jgi:hypothetical protein
MTGVQYIQSYDAEALLGRVDGLKAVWASALDYPLDIASHPIKGPAVDLLKIALVSDRAAPFKTSAVSPTGTYCFPSQTLIYQLLTPPSSLTADTAVTIGILHWL